MPEYRTQRHAGDHHLLRKQFGAENHHGIGRPIMISHLRPETYKGAQSGVRQRRVVLKPVRLLADLSKEGFIHQGIEEVSQRLPQFRQAVIRISGS